MKYKVLERMVDDYVVMDFETTGLTYTEHTIIQIGAIRYRNNDEVAVYETLVAYDGEVTPKITEITGIVAEDLVGKPTLKEALQKLVDFIGNDVIGLANGKTHCFNGGMKVRK